MQYLRGQRCNAPRTGTSQSLRADHRGVAETIGIYVMTIHRGVTRFRYHGTFARQILGTVNRLLEFSNSVFQANRKIKMGEVSNCGE